MGLFSHLKRRPLTRLERFNRSMSEDGRVRFVEESPPAGAPLPEEWRALPALSPAERVGVMADRMDRFVGDVLPETVAFFRRCGRDAELALWGERYIVVYTLVNSAGETVYYFGGDPMRPSWPLSSEAGYGRNVRAVWSRALDVWPFYRNFQDGFVSCAQPSTGVYQVGDINEFSTGEYADLGLDDEELRERARGCYPFYRSPTGDIVTLDITGQCPGRADLWHPHADPELDIDFWDTIDTLLTTTIDPEYYEAGADQ